jgi:hypothetical protein
LIQLLLLIGLVVFAVMAVQRLLHTAPAGAAPKFRRALLWGGVVFVLLLAATGRLGILIPLLGALITTLLRLLPVLVPMLLQYVPLRQRWERQQQGARQRAGGGGADVSSVESRFLRMHLDHATGEISGEILEGRYAGRQLSEMDAVQLADLYEECTRSDRESATLLRAYLERVYGESWDGGRKTRHEPHSGGRMTADEAREVLGLKPGATRNDIIGAHRRLMQRLHPDRGGSDYLAAKINQAKDILLGG